MKILYFGAGYVGACSAAISADSGHDVLVYDINSALVKALSSNDKDIIESKLYEKGLGDIIIRNKQRIRFTDNLADLENFIDSAEAIFMCLPTPEKDGSGETDLTFYEKAAATLAGLLIKRNKGAQSQYILLINKSTVPINMVNRTKEIMEQKGVKNFGVGANPEFLVEGKAIEGSIRPERIVVGAWEKKDFAIFKNIYNRFIEAPNVNYIEVNPMEAAASKLLANFFLFNRLANCFDVAGRLCEKFDHLHFENIRKILITDKRIGDWGFYDSLYAGGSCFIKDARSLSHQLKIQGGNTNLVDDCLKANQGQLNNFFNRAEKELNFSWPGKTAALLGLAFKRDTNDVRNSAALEAAKFLIGAGVKEIRAYDPAAGDNFLKHIANWPGADKIKLADAEEAAARDADVLIIAGDWPQFRELAELIKQNLAKGGLIMDGRRMLQQKYGDLALAGFNIIAVGSPVIRAEIIFNHN